MKIERNNSFTCSDLPEKERRNLIIFELIRGKKLISKPEISKITGINIVSVTNYIENYIAKSLISERESGVSSGGRKPDLVELNTKDRFVVGLDLCRGAVTATAANLGARQIARVGPRPVTATDTRSVASAAGEAFDAIMLKAAIAPGQLGAVGIGIDTHELSGVGEALAKRIGVDVFVGPSAQCAAYGERYLNEKVEDDDLLYVHSDLGCAVVIKAGRCYSPDGLSEGSGPAEGSASGRAGNGFGEDLQYLRPWDAKLGVVAAARLEVERGVGTKIVGASNGKADGVSVEAVIEAAKNDDKVASDILRNAGTNLGVRAAYLINVFMPRAVVIGGGIENAGELVLGPLRAAVDRFSFKRQASRVSIVPGSLGADAVSLGAATLAVREVFLRA